MDLKPFLEGFRNPEVITAFKEKIEHGVLKLGFRPSIMEICGGHTHVIAKYSLNKLLEESIDFIHGPGCPVCVMPKGRIDHALILAKKEGVILVTLGDMIKVPGSKGSLQSVRSEGADVRFVYSPLDIINIALENPQKLVIYFAIGFETTTPMSAALLERCRTLGIKNLLFHINHVRVPEAVDALLSDGKAKIDGFIGPSHVSVITGSKIYDFIADRYKKPVAVSGFEPVDVMQGVYMIVEQLLKNEAKVEIEYTRSVTKEGNKKAQELIDRYFVQRDSFEWRGLGDIPKSALKLRLEYADFDAEVRFADELSEGENSENRACICGDILKGVAKPFMCKLFATVCTPKNPQGSCMVSSEGACAAYYKYQR